MNNLFQNTNLQLSESVPAQNAPDVEDNAFSYDGYQVVRGEFFAHLFEPSVTLNNEKVSVNAACLRRLPKTDYVQFLVNPSEKKLAIKPCSEDAKDSFSWSTRGTDGKRRPKMISCKIFFAKVMELMNWNPNYRYKILGKLIRANNDSLFVFDLGCAETYQKRNAHGENTSRKALYPEEWKEQFGVPVSEHQDTVLISIFDDYTVFKINKEEETTNAYTSNNNVGYEEESDTYSQNNT
ncbi:hypothetical protein SAMN04487934_11812 [Eubacterium ruminantium]|nr:hypothetical protein SAMN04487934_11812 [Eubacterium ruminantium]